MIQYSAKSTYRTVTTFVLLAVSVLLCHANAQHLQSVVLPTPQLINPTNGTIRINTATAKVLVHNCDDATLDLLSLWLCDGKPLKVVNRGKADIRFTAKETLPAEAYELNITKSGVEIIASSRAGYVYALQSLRQCVLNQRGSIIELPCLKIEDLPKMGWRGFMLDSGRQFQRVETIKKYIDMASLLKLNKFHWHLTEGLGWRIEIKKYPKLTSVGACVGSGEQQQGFYTQEQIRDIVSYAASRNIEVIPEIDVPGHAEAALKAYSAYSCFGGPIEIPQTGFTKQIFCAGKDETISFLQDVLDEVCDLFPSKHIHLGGDEAPKDNWKLCEDCQHRIKQLGLKDEHALQLWFTAQLAHYLEQKGRKAVLWDDVVADVSYSLPSNVVVQWWNYRGHKTARLEAAVDHGMPVVCATNQYNYLNFPIEPWAGYEQNRTFGFKQAYEQNPSYGAMKSAGELLLGMSCSLWTDYGVTERMLDSRLFPRIFAIAELMWHSGDLLPAEALKQQIEQKRAFFEALGYEFGEYEKRAE